MLRSEEILSSAQNELGEIHQCYWVGRVTIVLTFFVWESTTASMLKNLMRQIVLLIKQKIRTAVGFRSGRSFPISYFRLRGNRQLLAFVILSLPIFLVFQIPAFLPNELLGIPIRSAAIVCAVIALFGVVWSTLWMRTRYVHIRRPGLVILLPFGQVTVPWKMIQDFETVNIERLYPVENLTVRQQQKLGRYYHPSGIVVHLQKNALGWRRWLMPWPLAAKDPQKIFLPVDEWSAFAEQLPRIMGSKSPKKEAKTRKTPAAPVNAQAKSKEVRIKADGKADILVVSAGSRHLGQLLGHLEESYQLVVAKSGIEAVRIFRSSTPSLILIDQKLDGDLTSLDLIRSLSRYKSRTGTSYLVMTDRPIDPDLELELFEEGIKEIIDIKRNPRLAPQRVEFWLKWQSQVENMAKRNQELYGQNLYQKSELARHGELMHFLPKDVAEEVIAGAYMKEATHLRKQTVTVLFADIVEFTPLSAQLTPDLLAELLNEYLQLLTQVVVNHGGIVDKFIGDEVMALFGAPEEQPETVQVQNAFSAAISMIEVIESLGDMWHSRLPAKLDIRIGVNTGQVTAGLFGSESLRSYTVIGSPVNLAARLTSAAPAGGIACCANSLKWVQMRTRYTSIGEVGLKGIVKPVEVYQIHEVMAPDKA